MELDVHEVAGALRVSIGLLVRRLRQVPDSGDLTIPETSALSRLDRGGPATSADLAKQEQISPQSMGATLAALEAKGLIKRSQDPADGRRILLSPTERGLEALGSRRNARTEIIATALSRHFTAAEREQLAVAAPLLERMAEAL
jgi:DNA-binding MarR family transcriptional regulator